MKKRFIIILLLLVFCCQQLSLGVPRAAQKYFDKATTLYLVGDLNNALRTIDRALNIDHNFTGAIKLKKGIIREMKLRKAKLVARASRVTSPTLPPVPTTIPESRPETEEVEVPPLANIFLLVGFLLGIFLVILSAAALVNYAKTVFGKRPEAKVPEVETEEARELEILREISSDQALWYQKFGWRSNPFTLDVLPELLSGYEKEVKEMLGKINSHSGHILVAGPLGIGKTTILRWLAAKLPTNQYLAIYIPRPPLEFNQLVAHIFQSMGYTFDQAQKESNLYNLGRLREKMKKHLVLLLDEAHEFTIEIERPLRTLGDIDGISLVMAGLPETVGKLKNEIQPLYERLVLKIFLDHLEFDELKTLIKVRIENVDGKGVRPFTAAALEKVFHISKGNPRKAIKLCDNAVAKAIEQGEEIIGPGQIITEKGNEL